MNTIVEIMYTTLLGFLVCSPMILLGVESQYFFLCRIPKLIPLLRIIFLNSHKEFQKIAQKSYYSRYYEIPYNSSEWYEKQTNLGLSRRISWRITLYLANWIMEYKVSRTLRSCENYTQLRYKAILWMMDMSDSGLAFISSPLYSHPKGIRKGIKDLRKKILDIAEENNGLVFNQIPFLNCHLPFIKEGETHSKFELFYQPVITSLPIGKIVMNEGWEKAGGCVKEYEIAQTARKLIEL